MDATRGPMEEALGTLGRALDQLREALPGFGEPATEPVTEPAPVTSEPVAEAPRSRRGRRPKPGTLPVMPERIAIVMGEDELDAAEIIARLKARDWMPPTADRAYVSYTLSQNTGRGMELFRRVDRGKYEVVEEKLEGIAEAWRKAG